MPVGTASISTLVTAHARERDVEATLLTPWATGCGGTCCINHGSTNIQIECARWLASEYAMICPVHC
jgi:hypothetical protein